MPQIKHKISFAARFVSVPKSLIIFVPGNISELVNPSTLNENQRVSLFLKNVEPR